jgi:hypothetical protein
MGPTACLEASGRALIPVSPQDRRDPWAGPALGRPGRCTATPRSGSHVPDRGARRAPRVPRSGMERRRPAGPRRPDGSDRAGASLRSRRPPDRLARAGDRRQGCSGPRWHDGRGARCLRRMGSDPGGALQHATEHRGSSFVGCFSRGTADASRLVAGARASTGSPRPPVGRRAERTSQLRSSSARSTRSTSSTVW